MQTTETTTGLVTMARAETLARVIHGQTADGDARPAIKQAMRVAQAVRTDRQRAILWARHGVFASPMPAIVHVRSSFRAFRLCRKCTERGSRSGAEFGANYCQ